MSNVIDIEAGRKKGQKATGRSIYRASASDQFFTPPWLLDVLQKAAGGRWTLDPATAPQNPTAAKYYVCGPADGCPDSLQTATAENPIPAAWLPAMRWALDEGEPLRVFCNPPYGRDISKWIRALAALGEMWQHRARILALVPTRTGTGWYVQAGRSGQLLCELRGRVTYLDRHGKPPVSIDRHGKERPTPARWANTVFYWGPDRAAVARRLRSIGEVRMCRQLPPAPPAADKRQLVLM